MQARRLQVGKRRGRHLAEAEDVVRHAVGVGAVELRRAHGLAGDRVAHDVQRAGDARFRKVIQVGLRIDDLPCLDEDVVVPVLENIALYTQDTAERRVTAVVLPPSALQVAAADEEVTGGRRGDAERVLESLGQERIIILQEKFLTAEEEAAGGDLRHRMVVVEAELAIRARMLVDVIVGKRVEPVSLVRALVVVVRSEIELVEGRVERPHAAGGIGDRERLAVDIVKKASRERRRRARAGQTRRIRAGCACAVVAIALQDCLIVLVMEEQRRVTLVVREIAAHGDACVVGIAIMTDIAGHGELLRVGGGACPDDIGKTVALIVVESAVVVFELQALEVLPHDEIDHARHRVGAIDRRRAAGQNFHPLDQRGGNFIDVRRVERGAPGRQPPAVDEHQGALRAEVSQIDRRRAGCAVGDVAAEIGEDLRQVIEQILDVGYALELDVGRGDLRHRACAGDVRRHDTRARDLRRGQRHHRRRLRVGDGDCCHRHTGAERPGQSQR